MSRLRFTEDESPMVMGEHGLEVAGPLGVRGHKVKVTNERLSCGVERLDSMLDGGYYRGASVLITGSPGSAIGENNAVCFNLFPPPTETTLNVGYESLVERLVLDCG